MSIKACMVCLATDVKLYHVKEGNIKTYMDYVLISQEKKTHAVKWLEFICYECAAILRNCHNFIKKCSETQAIVEDVLRTKEGKDRIAAIKGIDRLSCNLKSRLARHKTDPEAIIELKYKDTEYCDIDGIELGVKRAIKSEVKSEYDYYREDGGFDISDTNYDTVDRIFVEYIPDVSLKVEGDDAPLGDNGQNLDSDVPLQMLKKKTVQKRVRKPKVKKEKKVKEDPFVYPAKCEQCEEEIPNRVKHYHHYLIVHPDKEYPFGSKQKYICQYCGHTNTQKKHHQEHEMTHGERTLQCPLCPKKFLNKKALLKHRTAHSNYRPYKCNYCVKCFKTNNEHKRHVRTHTGEKPFACHLCDARFAHSGNRLGHVRKHHGQSLPEEKRTDATAADGYE